MRSPSKKSRRQAVLIFVLLSAVLAMGCHEQEESVPVKDRPKQSIRIGLVPEQDIFSQRRRYRPLARYLSEKADVNVELKALSRYGNIIENFVSADLDGAFFGSFTGALAHRKLGTQALARPEYLDGTSTYHGLIFVRRDSGISSLDDTKGKRFAFVDKATTAGWLFPVYFFKAQGIDDHESWLKESYFSGTHEGAIYDVLEGRADIGAAKNTVFSRLAHDDARLSEELLVLSRSADVPENSLCVRKDLSPLLKRKLQQALLSMDRDEEGKKVLRDFGAARFIPTTEEDYTVVFDFARKVGLDLNKYDYIND